MPRLSWISVLVVVVGCTCVALSSEAETAGTSAQGVLSLVCSKGALLCVCLSLLQLPRVAYNNRSSSVWRLAPQVKALADSVSGEGYLLAQRWSSPCCVVTRQGQRALWGLIY